MGPFLSCYHDALATFSDRQNRFGDKFDGVGFLFQSAWMTSALLFSLNTNVQRWLLQGRKQFSKLLPKICYFNPSVLTRHIKVGLQGKMLLVCLPASQTLLFLEDTSEKVPATAKEHNSALSTGQCRSGWVQRKNWSPKPTLVTRLSIWLLPLSVFESFASGASGQPDLGWTANPARQRGKNIL